MEIDAFKLLPLSKNIELLIYRTMKLRYTAVQFLAAALFVSSHASAQSEIESEATAPEDQLKQEWIDLENRDGVSITVSVVSVDKSSATIIRKRDGRQFKMELSNLSDESLKKIEKWETGRLPRELIGYWVNDIEAMTQAVEKEAGTKLDELLEQAEGDKDDFRAGLAARLNLFAMAFTGDKWVLHSLDYRGVVIDYKIKTIDPATSEIVLSVSIGDNKAKAEDTQSVVIKDSNLWMERTALSFQTKYNRITEAEYRKRISEINEERANPTHPRRAHDDERVKELLKD